MHDLSRYNSVLLFGGSFDPPHRAHTALPQQVAQRIGADAVAYLPAGRAPHKLDQRQTAPHHRLAMLRLAVQAAADDAHASPVPAVILTDELDRAPGEPSYTIDTLTRLRQQLGRATTLRLLIGGDQLRIFETWREPERIIELAEPVVMVRPPDSAASLLAALPDPASRDAWAPRLVDVPKLAISSTDIRQRVARGQPIDGLVAPGVAAYIDEHALYR